MRGLIAAREVARRACYQARLNADWPKLSRMQACVHALSEMIEDDEDHTDDLAAHGDEMAASPGAPDDYTEASEGPEEDREQGDFDGNSYHVW